MRHSSDHPPPYENQGLWRQQVQLARGHWRREEAAGTVRSAGWWESMTVTWAPAPVLEQRPPEHRPAVLQRALAVAADVIAPLLADAAAAGARRLLDARYRRHLVASTARRHLTSAARELGRSDGDRLGARLVPHDQRIITGGGVVPCGHRLARRSEGPDQG